MYTKYREHKFALTWYLHIDVVSIDVVPLQPSYAHPCGVVRADVSVTVLVHIL